MFKITQQGFDKITVDLGKISERSSDLSPALKQGRLVMLASVNKNFAQSGRPAWAPLRPATLKQKKRLGYSSAPLIRNGQLKRSIAGKVTRNSLRIGTAVPYAKFHQLGTSKMKARPFLVFQNGDVEAINQLVLNFIFKGGS